MSPSVLVSTTRSLARSEIEPLPQIEATALKVTRLLVEPMSERSENVEIVCITCREHRGLVRGSDRDAIEKLEAKMPCDSDQCAGAIRTGGRFQGPAR